MPAAISCASAGGVSSSPSPTSTSVGHLIDGQQRPRIGPRHDRMLLADECFRPGLLRHDAHHAAQVVVALPVVMHEQRPRADRALRRTVRSSASAIWDSRAPSAAAYRAAPRCRAAPAARPAPAPAAGSTTRCSRPSKARRAQTAAARCSEYAPRSPPWCRHGAGRRPSTGPNGQSAGDLFGIEPRRAEQPWNQHHRLTVRASPMSSAEWLKKQDMLLNLLPCSRIDFRPFVPYVPGNGTNEIRPSSPAQPSLSRHPAR